MNNIQRGDVTLFYKRGCQGKKLPLRLEVAKKFFLTSSPCIDRQNRQEVRAWSEHTDALIAVAWLEGVGAA
jgi:hypothetical protein